MVELVHTIKAHNDRAWEVSSHSFYPLLASASTDKTSNVYLLSSKKKFPLITKLEEAHKRSVRSVAFKPPLQGATEVDLPTLASGSFDSTISIWGIEEPAEELEEEALDDKQNQWNLIAKPENEWNLMAIIEGHENEIKSVAWNYQGNLLASCSRDKTIWIWETDPETLEEFECISVLSDHEHDIKHLAWHPNRNLLASSSYDDTIHIYKQDEEEDDWCNVSILNGHQGTVWCSQFEDPESPGSEKGIIRLVSASDDLTVKVWSAEAGPDPEQDKGERLPSALKSSPETMHWEEESTLPAIHKYPVYSVAWSRKSGRIASAGADGSFVIYKRKGESKEWEIESAQELSHGVYELNCITWCVLAEGDECIVTAGDNGEIKIWRV